MKHKHPNMVEDITAIAKRLTAGLLEMLREKYEDKEDSSYKQKSSPVAMLVFVWSCVCIKEWH